MIFYIFKTKSEGIAIYLIVLADSRTQFIKFNEGVFVFYSKIVKNIGLKLTKALKTGKLK